MPCPYSEYSPSWLQCHKYTAAPSRAAHPFAWSTTVRLIVSGTPSAVPLADPKLERMSLRTMPDWVSTLGPLEPSPGYGPAVSCGISSQVAERDPVGVEVAVDAADEPPESGPHPARVASPAAASMVRARRRFSSVDRSKARPRSWSCSSSCTSMSMWLASVLDSLGQEQLLQRQVRPPREQFKKSARRPAHGLRDHSRRTCARRLMAGRSSRLVPQSEGGSDDVQEGLHR